MAIYQIHFQANPVLWPKDPKERLEYTEAMFQGARAGSERHDGFRCEIDRSFRLIARGAR